MAGEMMREGLLASAGGAAAEAGAPRRRAVARCWRLAGASVLGLCGIACLASTAPSRQAPFFRGATGLAAAGSPKAPRSFKFLQVEEAVAMLEKGLSNHYHRYEVPRDLAVRLAEATNAAMLTIRGALLADGYSEADVPLVGPTLTPRANHSRVAKWAEAHRPSLLRLSLAGGVCGGKTSSKKAVEWELETRSRGRLVVVSVPEVASILFGLGVMNFGVFATENPKEYISYLTNNVVLQLALEELFAEAASDMLKQRPGAQHIVMLADRDAIDAKPFTQPILEKEVEWHRVVEGAGRILGQANLTEADLVRRYRLGTVVLQSYAVVAGQLNREGYDKACLGPAGSNAVRHETAEIARAEDERTNIAYAEAYPSDKFCRVTNKAPNNYEEKAHDVLQCVWKHLDSELGYSIRALP